MFIYHLCKFVGDMSAQIFCPLQIKIYILLFLNFNNFYILEMVLYQMDFDYIYPSSPPIYSTHDSQPVPLLIFTYL